MTLPDLINGLFECAGGFFLLLSVRRLYREKLVRGVSWVPTTFFATWGLWNLFFYPHLGQWLSFAGGAFLTAINFVWLAQMVYYIRAERIKDRDWL